MQKPSPLRAVLTGDLVGSRRLASKELQQATRALESAEQKIRSWGPQTVCGSMAFFRGDAWQLLLMDATRALRAALLVRAILLASDTCDTRIAIGLGEVDSLDPDQISRSTGEAFTLSGTSLDTLKDPFRLAIAVPRRAPSLHHWLPVVARLCDALVRDWTRRQAEILIEALDPQEPTQQQIAGRIQPPVTQQSVAHSLAGAHWNALHAAVRVFEQESWDNWAEKNNS